MPIPSEASLIPFVEPSAVAQMAGNCTFLDVRSPVEFQSEHISGSINVPLGELERRVNEVPRAEQLIVVCRSGMRARRAAFSLMGKGFEPKVLKGGLTSWKNEGLSLIEGKRMLSIERQIQLIVGVGVLTGVVLSVTVNPWFLIIPGFFGAGLTFAGLTGTCALGLLLDKAPWNQFEAIAEADHSSCRK